MLFGPLLDERVLREAVERKHRVRFWGESYTIKPLLVSEKLGDGLGLIFIEPLFTRPNYYVIRVDSSWVAPNRWGQINIRDHLFEDEERVLCVIEDDFCNERWYSEEECDEEIDDAEREALRDWPAFHDGGYSFGAIYTDELLKEYGRRLLDCAPARPIRWWRGEAREAYRVADHARRAAARMARGASLLTRAVPT